MFENIPNKEELIKTVGERKKDKKTKESFPFYLQNQIYEKKKMNVYVKLNI